MVNTYCKIKTKYYTTSAKQKAESPKPAVLKIVNVALFLTNLFYIVHHNNLYPFVYILHKQSKSRRHLLNQANKILTFLFLTYYVKQEHYYDLVKYNQVAFLSLIRQMPFLTTGAFTLELLVQI